MIFDKLLQPFSKKTDKIEVNVKKQQEIEYVLMGTIKPKKGQKVFEINTNTKNCIPAEYKMDTISLNGDAGKEKLIVRADCIYIAALNHKNAIKKYKANNLQDFYYSKEAPMKINDLNFTHD